MKNIPRRKNSSYCRKRTRRPSAASRSYAAQTGVPTGKASAAGAGQPGKNTTTPVRAASASVGLTDDNMPSCMPRKES